MPIDDEPEFSGSFFGFDAPDDICVPDDFIMEYTSNCPECDSLIKLTEQDSGLLDFECESCGTQGSIQLEDDIDE